MSYENHRQQQSPPQSSRPKLVIGIGKFRLQGWSAGAVLLLILILLAIRIAYSRPSFTNWPLGASAAEWILFGIYWGIAAKNSAPAKSSESRESRRVHELLLNGGLLLIFVPVPGLRHRFLPASPLTVPIGLATQTAFLLLAVWARRHLGKNWSGEITIKVDHQLIRSGPYRVVRHPIYTAMLGMFVGSVTVSAQLHALVGLMMAAFAYWRKIRLEEVNLDRAFGPGYDAYRRDTWALLPGLF